MRAIICNKYRSTSDLELVNISKPVANDNEVLIKVHATTVTTGDWRIQSLSMPRGFGFLTKAIFGFNKPRQPILGTELSGEVESVGKNVTKFKVGDQVVAATGAKYGCHAEYVCLSEDAVIVHKPENLSYEEAAAIPFGGNTAYLYLSKKAKIKAGDKVLIYGASGSVGIAAVQVAKYYGAIVTGVCSTANVDLVKSVGADHVIDYSKVRVTDLNEKYDIILDPTGLLNFSNSKNILSEGGRLLLISADLPETLSASLTHIIGSKKVIAGPVTPNSESLKFLVYLASNGKFKSVIDRVFPLERIADAYDYVSKRHKKGNVVIKL